MYAPVGTRYSLQISLNEYTGESPEGFVLNYIVKEIVLTQGGSERTIGQEDVFLSDDSVSKIKVIIELEKKEKPKPEKPKPEEPNQKNRNQKNRNQEKAEMEAVKEEMAMVKEKVETEAEKEEAETVKEVVEKTEMEVEKAEVKIMEIMIIQMEKILQEGMRIVTSLQEILQKQKGRYLYHQMFRIRMIR